MKKSVSIMIAALLLLTGLNLVAEVRHAENSVNAAAPQAGTTEKLCAGTYIVYARSPQAWRFTVDPKTMANATVVGHFAVSAGSPQNVDVLIYSEENFHKWRSDDAATQTSAGKPVYQSGRKTEGDVSVKITEPGNYYLVLSNLFAYEGTKTVNADFKLQFDKK